MMETEIGGIKIQFINRNIRLTEYLRDYFVEKFEKLTSKIPEGLKKNTKAYFIYKKEGDIRIGEIIITIAKRHFTPLYASDEGQDPRALIDTLIQDIERQIEKLKTEFERLIREEMKTKREIPQGEGTQEEEQGGEAGVESGTELEMSENLSLAEPEIEIIRLKLEKPLTIDDAMFMLEEIEKKKGSKKPPIYVFTDYDGKVKILFRKREGKYTLFEIV